jgi:hypothetical protein
MNASLFSWIIKDNLNSYFFSLENNCRFEKNKLMKTNTLTKLCFGISMLIALNLLMTSCGNGDTRKSFPSIVEYNDYIVAEMHRIDDFYNSGIRSVKDSTSAVKFCTQLKEETEKSLEVLNIQPFEGDSTMTEAAKKLVVHLNKVSMNELSEYFGLVFYSNLTGSVLDAKRKELEEKIDGPYKQEWSNIHSAQQTLSAKFNTTIKEN